MKITFSFYKNNFSFTTFLHLCVNVLLLFFLDEFFLGKCLLTEFNFSIKLLAFSCCILSCYLLNMPSFRIGSIYRLAYIIPWRYNPNILSP